MAKKLRLRLATTILCGTMMVNVAGQVSPLFAEEILEVKEELEVKKYTTDIYVYQETSDEPSKASAFMDTKDLSLEISDGKVYLTLKIKNSMAGKEMISSLEHKKKDGTYETVEWETLVEGDQKYALAKICLEEIEKDTVLKIAITFMGNMPVSFRVVLPEETKQLLKEELGETKEELNMTISHTNETAYGANNGSITIVAQGGVGDYFYTIDGGENWGNSPVFENLTPGIYVVGVKDGEGRVTGYQEVQLKKKEKEHVLPFMVVDGEYNVNVDILNVVTEEISPVASSFKTDNVKLIVKDGRASLEVYLKNIGSIVQGLWQERDGQFIETELEQVELNEITYAKGVVTLDSINETILLKSSISMPNADTLMPTYKIRLSKESIKMLEEKAQPVTMTYKVQNVTNEKKGSIAITAVGGTGVYEYTIDGGQTWEKVSYFENLNVGTYKIGIRDAQYVENMTQFATVKIVSEKAEAQEKELTDGYYSVDIKVLHENMDTNSVAASFFNKKALPLEIRNGKAYLTIQVAKDGNGMTDVIESLEQRIGSSYKKLKLNYLNDESKRYITTVVELGSITDTAYVRCNIKAMSGLNPVLRIKLIESSIQSGNGYINEELGESDTIIKNVKAENGKVTITLSKKDHSLKASDFIGKLYLNDSKVGKTISLTNFKMQDTIVTFNYEKLSAIDKEQKVNIGIYFKGIETKSEPFSILAESEVEELDKVEKSPFTFKENVHEIKYINGYTDRTFKPNHKVSKQEALSMLYRLVEKSEKKQLLANIEVLQSDKDAISIAKQFFKTEGIVLQKTEDGYLIQLEIANEGLGFSNIITGISQKIDGSYQSLEVIKSSDMKKAYVTIKMIHLNDPIILKTGIAPMGEVMPELRILIDEASIKEADFKSQYEDIGTWAEEAITFFESHGVIGQSHETFFYPDKPITRGEFTKIIASLTGLKLESEDENAYIDLEGHQYEKYILAATKAGYVAGFEDKSFRPDKTLSRAEAVVMINRVLGHDENTDVERENPFKDIKTNHWAYKEIIKVTNV